VKRGVFLGSIAAHAAIAALLYGVVPRAPAPRPERPIELELVEAAPAVAAPAMPASVGGGSRGGGASPAPSLTPLSTPAPTTARAAPPPRLAAAARRPRTSAFTAAERQLAITGFDRGDPAVSDDGARTSGGLGLGAGPGMGGLGTGLGTGSGAGPGGTGPGGLGAPPAVPPPPPPPPPPAAEKPPSKARPPRLIYPARDREGDAAETFLARLIVDADGYVVGARLLRGIGGPRDELASQLVWRFRYAPALDDGGRAVRATIEQRFLVGY
jgi:hypothetical protein